MHKSGHDFMVNAGFIDLVFDILSGVFILISSKYGCI